MKFVVLFVLNKDIQEDCQNSKYSGQFGSTDQSHGRIMKQGSQRYVFLPGVFRGYGIWYGTRSWGGRAPRFIRVRCAGEKWSLMPGGPLFTDQVNSYFKNKINGFELIPSRVYLLLFFSSLSLLLLIAIKGSRVQKKNLCSYYETLNDR
jgi:hypothetical protein